MLKNTQGSRAGKFAILGVLVSVGLSTSALAYTEITSQLDFGARGYNVTNLQTFFADNAAIYPEGLITGYFGGLTRAGVVRFQAAYGLDQVGRVGPMTLAKINGLIASGGWVTVDFSGPGFYNVSKTSNNNSATMSFSTSENTIAKVVYSLSPIMFNEGEINSNGFGPLSGSVVASASGLSTSHSITVSGLMPNTNYYYTVIATDASGNVSVIGPNNVVRTSN